MLPRLLISLLLLPCVMAEAGSAAETTGVAGTRSVAGPRQPVYRVLQRSHMPDRMVPQVRSGYAYGWFGVAARRHPERHFGYHRNYTQWSWK